MTETKNDKSKTHNVVRLFVEKDTIKELKYQSIEDDKEVNDLITDILDKWAMTAKKKRLAPRQQEQLQVKGE